MPNTTFDALVFYTAKQTRAQSRIPKIENPIFKSNKKIFLVKLQIMTKT